MAYICGVDERCHRHARPSFCNRTLSICDDDRLHASLGRILLGSEATPSFLDGATSATPDWVSSPTRLSPVAKGILNFGQSALRFRLPLDKLGSAAGNSQGTVEQHHQNGDIYLLYLSCG